VRESGNTDEFMGDKWKSEADFPAIRVGIYGLSPHSEARNEQAKK
jgi:hypothetical protein